MDVIFKFLKKDDNKDFWQVQKPAEGESHFNQNMPLRNQLAIAAEIFGGGQKLSLIPIPTKTKDMDEQLKQAHKIVDVLDCPKRKIRVTMLRCNVDKPKRSEYNVQLLAGRRRTRNFNKLSMWNLKLNNLSIYLLYWHLYMINLSPINPIAKSDKK